MGTSPTLAEQIEALRKRALGDRGAAWPIFAHWFTAQSAVRKGRFEQAREALDCARLLAEVEGRGEEERAALALLAPDRSIGRAPATPRTRPTEEMLRARIAQREQQLAALGSPFDPPHETPETFPWKIAAAHQAEIDVLRWVLGDS